MSGNNGKKPKIFVKKRSDEVSSEHDEFYEYDNLKSKSYTIDESFFEDFESVDFDKKNYEKENTSSEETKDEVLTSEEILEDEVFQEIPDEIDAKEENEVEIVNEKKEFIHPEKAENNKRVFAYLHQTRGIDNEIIQKAMEMSKKGDVLKVSTEDIVGNISEPYIIKVGETPSVVKPDSNNKEEQKVDNEQGTNKETGEKSESKEKGKTEVKPTEEKGISSSQTGKNETSKETDLKVTDSTSSDKTLKSNSNVSKDQQATSNIDRKENNGTVVGEKSKTGYSNNTNSGLTSSVQKVQDKQNKSLPNTGTVNHLFAMISGLVSLIVGSAIFRLKRRN